MSKLFKSLLLAATVAISLIGNQAHAAPFVFTAYGTITSGQDHDGIFGNAASALDGQLFSRTISFETSQNSTQFDDQYYSYAEGNAGNATATDITTVNGHVFSTLITTTSNGNYASIANFLTQLGTVYSDGHAWYDSVFGSVCGNAEDGQFTCGWQSLSSTINPFVAAPELDQSLSYTTQAGDISDFWFYTSGIHGSANFNGTISAITLNAGTVPEPATLALFAFGLLGVISLRRRKQS